MLSRTAHLPLTAREMLWREAESYWLLALRRGYSGSVILEDLNSVYTFLRADMAGLVEMPRC